MQIGYVSFFMLCIPNFFTLAVTPRIAVIGSGIGGTSCTYFLRLLFGDDLEIDLYEAEEIGGRLSIANFGGEKYEIGGSVIHSRNRYMTDFLHMLNLSKREQSSDSYFGLYDGKNFAFQESTSTVVTLFNLIRRYHFGFWKLKMHINHMLDKFERIYKYQDDGVTFNNVPSLLSAMDPVFVNYLQLSSKIGFQEEGFSDIVINELVTAALRTNYGQGLNAQKFVGSVSVAGAIGGLWAFHGGNAKVPEELLKVSKARLIRAAVTKVRRLNLDKMEVIVDRELPSLQEDDRKYDVIVIAAPQTADMKYRIQFENFEKEINFPGQYHKLFCSLFKGNLNDKYFTHKNPCTDTILSISDRLFFNSISRINPVDYKKGISNTSDVWKIFSQKPIHNIDSVSLFSEISDKYEKFWLSYPKYDTSERNDSFILDGNLYHINAIEWAASSMEMSVIGARNVALLVFQNWKRKKNEEEKTEKEEYENNVDTNHNAKNNYSVPRANDEL